MIIILLGMKGDGMLQATRIPTMNCRSIQIGSHSIPTKNLNKKSCNWLVIWPSRATTPSKIKPIGLDL